MGWGGGPPMMMPRGAGNMRMPRGGRMMRGGWQGPPPPDSPYWQFGPNGPPGPPVHGPPGMRPEFDYEDEYVRSPPMSPGRDVSPPPPRMRKGAMSPPEGSWS